MKTIIYLFIFSTYSMFCQEPIETLVIKEDSLKVDTLVSVDNFGTLFFVKNDVFTKKTPQNTLTYNNFQLGKLNSVNAFNPLKINLFYKDFNTVIILDNRLAEIFKIDFNAHTSYKNITHVATGFDNTLWVFNQDLQKLELFDYKTQTTRAQTVPIQSTVLDLKSNYNYCWLLTSSFLYKYNYFGSLVKKIKNNGFTELIESNDSVFLKKDSNLFYLDKNSDTPIPIKTPNLLVKQFFVTNQTLYIYNNKTLQQLQIKN